MHDDRIVCEVVVSPQALRMTSPALMEDILKDFPRLARHACVNEVGNTFAAVMNHTSIPHVLEHLVIDAQVRAYDAEQPIGAKSPVPDLVFVGTTEWIDEQAGRARIEVNFADDLVALRAFRDATCFLNKAMVPYAT